MVAAILTRLNLTDAISANLGYIYTNSSAFNDLGSTAYPVDTSSYTDISAIVNGTTGTVKGTGTDYNKTCTPTSLCTAGPGWDGPSGIGSPNGTALSALSSSSSSGSGSGGGATDGGSEGGASGSGSGSSSGGASGSGSSSGGSGSSSGGLSSSGSGIIEDAGVTSSSGGGGGGDGGGNGFEPGGSSGSSGCSTTPGNSPLQDTGVMAMLVGAFALIGSRRRKK
jgi:hypothetical protein